MSEPAHVVRIHPDDNVLVLTRTVQPGDAVELEGRPVTVDRPLSLGHKLAARPIAKGERILKYGLPIGTATAAIRAPGANRGGLSARPPPQLLLR